MTDMNTIFADARELVRREQAVEHACTGIPTEALEAGVVEKMMEALGAIQHDAETTHLQGCKATSLLCAHGRVARALLRQIKGDQHD